jgi:hypothetical protein
MHYGALGCAMPVNDLWLPPYCFFVRLFDVNCQLIHFTGRLNSIDLEHVLVNMCLSQNYFLDLKVIVPRIWYLRLFLYIVPFFNFTFTICMQ